MEQDKMTEIMEEMKKNSQKSLMHHRIQTAFLLVFVLSVLVLLPSVFSTLHSAQVALTHVDVAVVEMETALQSVEVLADDAGAAVTSAETALQKINEIDIDTLNDAIKDLSDVVQPMADFFSVFKK